MKFLKKNKHLLIVLALFIALAAIAAGCTGKASGAENKGNDDYVVNISGADEMPHGTDFGSTESPSSTPIPTDTPEPTATPAPTAASVTARSGERKQTQIIQAIKLYVINIITLESRFFVHEAAIEHTIIAVRIMYSNIIICLLPHILL